jgi:hypothetical protein
VIAGLYARKRERFGGLTEIGVAGGVEKLPF